MENILYINACIRQNSRTDELAKYLLNKLKGNIEEVNLSMENIPLLTNDILEKRTSLINKNEFSNEYFKWAKQFAKSDTIVISAPYWDLSFPAILKIYFEAINITKLVFKYTQDGKIESLCKAKRLIFITTSGGPIIEPHVGLEYIKLLAKTFYDIPQIEYFKAEFLDIAGNNQNDILLKTKQEIDLYYNNDLQGYNND